MKRLLFFVPLCLYYFVVSASAQVAVAEVNSVPTLLNVAKSAYESVKQTAAQVLIVEQQADQLRNELAMIKNQVQNLQRLPGSIVQDVRLSGNKLTALLGAADRVSFSATASAQQFDQLYNQSLALGESKDAIMTRLEWLTTRQQLAQTTVKTGSIVEDLSQKFDNLRKLLTFSFGAKGNLDSQQILAQTNALQADIAMRSQAMQAALQQMAAAKEREQVALEKARLGLIDSSMQPLDTSQPYEATAAMQEYRLWYGAH